MATQQKLLELQNKILDTVNSTLKTTITDTITECLEKRAAESNQITMLSLKAALDDARRADDNAIAAGIREQIKGLELLIGELRRPPAADPPPASTPTPAPAADSGTFSYDGKLWDLPKDYKFPTADINRATGFDCWMVGDKGNAIGPWRELNPKRMSTKQKTQYTVLKGALKFFEGGLTTPVPPKPERTPAYLKTADAEVTAYLKRRVNYLFQNGHKTATMKMSTWAKNVKPSVISKKGTASDNEALKSDTRRKKKRRVSSASVVVESATASPAAAGTVQSASSSGGGYNFAGTVLGSMPGMSRLFGGAQQVMEEHRTSQNATEEG